MKNVRVQLRLPKELRDVAARQAAASGVSLNLFLATAVASRVRAQAGAERHLGSRGARKTVARTKALLGRLGTVGAVAEEDNLDADR